MNNIRPFFKRVSAYIVDLLIVITVTSLLTKIPFINKYMDKYNNTYTNYLEDYTEYNEYISLLSDSFEDETINEEEYNKLIENEKFKDLIISHYEDKQISKEEYKDITKELNQQFDLIAKDYVYLLDKQSIFNTVLTLVTTLLYFGVLQYFLKGETIGKKLFKLQVVSASDKQLTIFNYLLRSLIVNNVLINTVNTLIIIYASKSLYQNISTITSTLISLIEAAIIFLVLTRSDQRGLHDLLVNTKVVSTELKKESTKENNVIEAKYDEIIEKKSSKKNKETQTVSKKKATKTKKDM